MYIHILYLYIYMCVPIYTLSLVTSVVDMSSVPTGFDQLDPQLAQHRPVAEGKWAFLYNGDAIRFHQPS